MSSTPLSRPFHRQSYAVFCYSFSNADCKYDPLPALTLQCRSPHAFRYKENYYAVNERFQRIDGFKNPRPLLQKLKLYHYVLKSKDEYRV